MLTSCSEERTAKRGVSPGPNGVTIALVNAVQQMLQLLHSHISYIFLSSVRGSLKSGSGVDAGSRNRSLSRE